MKSLPQTPGREGRRLAVWHELMSKGLICCFLLLCQLAIGAATPDLSRLHTSEDLAKFIHSHLTNQPQLKELLEGLDRPGAIRLATYSNAIPIREIYATIIELRFGDDLPRSYYRQGTSQDVRAICSFGHNQGGETLWRFHILIFDERGYEILKATLKKQLNKRTKGTAASPQPKATTPRTAGKE